MSLELQEALIALKRTAKEFKRETEELAFSPIERLKPLRDVIEKLDKPTKPPKPKKDILKQWNEFIRGNIESLESRTIRYLYWEPEAVKDRRFHDYLDKHYPKFGHKALQGLVRSCHSLWSDKFLEDSMLGRVVKRLQEYKGNNSIISTWKYNTDLILGSTGPTLLANRLVVNPQLYNSIKDFFDIWIIDERTAYAKSTIQQAAHLCREKIGRDWTLGNFLITRIFTWQEWTLDEFKREISQTIMNQEAVKSDKFRKDLLDFIFNDPRLGDPRLKQNDINWIGIHKYAKASIIQWISRDDIIFFFNHIMRPGEDKHDRKGFWLKYVNACKRSRPLLNKEDEPNLPRSVKNNTTLMERCGRIKGSTSAFLLDFGTVLAIEFHEVGACYIYDRATADKYVVPDFWTSKPFDVRDLKQPDICQSRITRNPKNWKDLLKEVLAKHGVRPLA
jgi:hypothetical protein